MARNNLIWIKGDITGDIYYDVFKLESKDIQFLRLYMMVKGVTGAASVKGIRVCVYGPLAELVYGYVRKGSRLGIIGHLQQRKTRKGEFVFEVVSEEIEFIHNIEWETGDRVRRDLVQRGLLRPQHKDQDQSGVGMLEGIFLGENTIIHDLSSAIPEDVILDE